MRKARPRKSYHHGDLRRALVEEAVRIISDEGVAGLTLRAVGARLGVSRTALYRHFADKGTLLAVVAAEGFRAFRAALHDAVVSNGGGVAGFEAMGRGYITFALEHPSHYRVMFGGFLEACPRSPEMVAEAEGSFRVLVDSIVSLQQAGYVRAGDPQQLARYVWAVSHGVAMLVLDGQLPDVNPMDEMRYAIGRIRDGIAAHPDEPRSGNEPPPHGV
jgi:AcrR family transcriptional regulator